MVNLYESLQDMLEREVEKIVQRGELDQNSLCNLDKLIDVIKDTEEITAMRNYGGEYSGGRMNYNNGYSNRYYDNRNMNRYQYDDHYSNGMSYGQNGMNSNNGYSGHGDKNHMLSLMHEAMDMASTNEEREEIRQMIRKIENK